MIDLDPTLDTIDTRREEIERDNYQAVEEENRKEEEDRDYE